MYVRRSKVEKKDITENNLKKRFLWSYQDSKCKMARLDEQLEELTENKLSIKVSGDGMPHRNDTSDLSDYVSKKDEIERDIIRERYKSVQRFILVRKAIEEMGNEKEKNILTYRYLRGYDWDVISRKTGYCIQWVHKIHAKALAHFKIPEEAIESDT